MNVIMRVTQENSDDFKKTKLSTKLGPKAFNQLREILLETDFLHLEVDTEGHATTWANIPLSDRAKSHNSSRSLTE